MRTKTATIRVTDALIERCAKFIQENHKKGGNLTLSQLGSDALIAYLDDYDNERGLLNENHKTKK